MLSSALLTCWRAYSAEDEVDIVEFESSVLRVHVHSGIATVATPRVVRIERGLISCQYIVTL